MRWRIIFVAATALGCACGQDPHAPVSNRDAAPQAPPRAPISLDATVCQPVTAVQKPWLSPELATFATFAIACPVRAGATTVLYVVSLDGYALEKSLPPNVPAPRLPKALLVLPDGRKVGTLPLLYPFDPPVTVNVTFTNWASNIPRTVEVAVDDPGVGGPRRLPSLEWNEKRQAYDTP